MKLQTHSLYSEKKSKVRSERSWTSYLHNFETPDISELIFSVTSLHTIIIKQPLQILTSIISYIGLHHSFV